MRPPIFTFIIGLLLLTGCSGRAPVKGQWYEHKVSRERVRVEYVGRGKDIASIYMRSAELQNADILAVPGKPDPGQYSLQYSETDGNSKCVGFSQSNSRTFYYVMPIVEFTKDYTLVKGR
ncbi:MAG: hypothetical protein WC712_14695 [Candidatus Brocadiia bacterium]